jgi:triacylglycerol lipase
MARKCLLVLTITLVTSVACAAEDETSSDGETAQTKEEIAEAAVAGKADWSWDPCERRGWYGDGDCDWFCPKKDSDCAPATLFADPKGDVAAYPVILHHGFAGGHSFIFAWTGVAEALSADGHVVGETMVPPFDGISVRAIGLKRAIDDMLGATGAEKVNIIAHSMGGLDARYLVSTLGYGDRIASITTISTPHQGTNVADFALSIVPGFADPAVDSLFELFGNAISDHADSTEVRSALTDLSEAASTAFNAANPDDGRVFYQSWAGVSSVLGLAKYARDAELRAACDNRLIMNEGTFDRFRSVFIPLSPIIGKLGGNGKWHDGLVSVESARHGEFRGCIPADHSDQVGKVTSGSPDPQTGFNPSTFYRTLTFELAARGF